MAESATKTPSCSFHFVHAFHSPQKIAFSPDNSKISPAYIVCISAGVLPAMVIKTITYALAVHLHFVCC